MKLKVIGWTNGMENKFPEGHVSFASNAAVIDEIRKHSYVFSGVMHQDDFAYCVPVLNNGTYISLSQRGWGGLMAEAYGYNEPYDYCKYAFAVNTDDEEKLPSEEVYIHNIFRGIAEQTLSQEELELLFEEDYTFRFPHPELPEREMYLLTPEEAEQTSIYETVRQVPGVLYDKIVEPDLNETFTLDADECKFEDDVHELMSYKSVRPMITLKYDDKYRMLAPGDTVTVGDKSYLVRDVDICKDVTNEVRFGVMYSTNENYEESLKIFNAADFKMKIYY